MGKNINENNFSNKAYYNATDIVKVVKKFDQKYFSENYKTCRMIKPQKLKSLIPFLKLVFKLQTI